MFSNIYAGKTVLVTGHTGFKGSWLTLWLQKLGARVIGYALAPPSPGIFESGDMAASLEHIEDDIRNRDAVIDVIQRNRPDFIFHLAAQPLVRESYETPCETFDVNVMGTVNVLEAVRQSPWPCSVVIVSTDKCYENREWDWGYRESDPMGGYDPYSASKGAMEVMLTSWRLSFFHPERVAQHGVRLASARAGNVIGGGDWAKDRIVPDAIGALSLRQPIVVRNPNDLRPWQHVLEPLSGYLQVGAEMAAEGGERYATSWNFGPLSNQNYRVRDLVESLIASWGEGSWDNQQDPNALHEAGLLKLCIDKAHLRLGWEPAWDFQTTVQHTVNWYRTALAGADAEGIRNACYADIDSYCAAAREKGVRWIS